jgi:hypothetical protein
MHLGRFILVFIGGDLVANTGLTLAGIGVSTPEETLDQNELDSRAVSRARSSRDQVALIAGRC